MIVGLTGTLGAGKSTIAEYLSTSKGYTSFSARDILKEESENRGQEPNRDTFREIANDLSSAFGPDFIAKLLYKKAVEGGGDVVFESIRRPAEAEFLRQQGDCILVSVDAHLKARYERIQERGSEKDHVSFEEFVTQEKVEMETKSKHEQSISAVMDAANFCLTNNGTKEELYREIERILNEVS